MTPEEKVLAAISAEEAGHAIYTEADIADCVRDYADHHGIRRDAVDVCRQYHGGDGAVIGFRLSGGGNDERFGAWGQ